MIQAMPETFKQKSSLGVVLTRLSANHGLRHAFGTKELANEERLAQAMDQEGIPVVSVHQVHGDGILVLDQPAEDWAAAQKKTAAAGRVEGYDAYDAIVTDQTGVILAVRTADCLPVLIFDPMQRVIAAVHAGWRGALREIVPKTVRCMMDRFSCRPAAIIVGVGPSVRSCCYEVGEMVLAPL
ncbi:MAG TPA: polyphenol oxidase family protein, partial [Nitrospiria bacterium]|nr:polyphenol oxidase family protein [Nitrospiria bacterium]